MSTLKTIYTTTVCTLLAVAVVLSGSHAKDIASLSLPAVWLDAKKQADDAHQQIVKVATELHTHTDKTVKVMSDAGDHNNQADGRSLRLLHEKKDATYRNRIADRLRFWWQMSTLYLS